jgi:hypothetical protein
MHGPINVKSPNNISEWQMEFNSAFEGLKLKLKQSHYRPGQALSVPGGGCSQISRHLAHEGGKVASLTHRPPLPPLSEYIPGTHFC